MRIGMLTGGGDCPGLNAVIRAVVRKGVFHYHDEFIGFMEGWRGLIEDHEHAARPGCGERNSAPRRYHPAHVANKSFEASRTELTAASPAIDKHKIDALIAIGGDDTLSVAQQAPRKRSESCRSAEDHRQRSRGHRLHFRI